MTDDFRRFGDDVLVSIADEQEPPGLAIIDIRKLCERKGIPAAPTWLELIASDLEQQGFGTDCSGKGESQFLINGAGLRRAAEIRAARKPMPFSEQVASDKVQKISTLAVAVISLLAALAALAIAFLTYMKS